MKIFISSILYPIAVVALLSSCLKDKGNYDYKEINEVGIGGVEQKIPYEVFSFIDTLKINPLIQAADVEDKNRYNYEWKLIKSSGDQTVDSIDYVISTDPQLKYPVTLPAGEYKGYLKVTDKVEETSWGVTFFVLVRTITNEGYMVLCDDGGKGRLDVIASVSEKEYKIAYDIWKNEDYDWGKPYAIFFNYNLQSGSTTYYVAEKGTYGLNKNLLTSEAQDMKWAFGEVPEKVSIKGMNSTTFSFDRRREVLVNEKNQLYARNTTLGGSLFEFPINFVNGRDEFKASKHIGMPIPNSLAGYFPYGHTILIYDETNKQFLELIDKNEFPTPIKFSNTNYFPTLTGRDMVHVESTSNGLTFAVLKDPIDKKFYMYGMRLGENAVNTQQYYMEIPIATTSTINHFAFHPVLPYLFYATDHTVYQFDYSQPNLSPKVALNYPNDKIAVMKYFPLVGWNPYALWEREKAFKLFVARNVDKGADETGVLELYTAPALGQPLVRNAEFEGLGKIIDIEIRER
ncbi:PKD-like family lipoprotein [Sphingobacterium faecale]|uniref:PKD family protein n=1 Tax=Sphingobacterium faecale TaxID=2803775 RepID=A0ABS1R928_9SPHI|nr:PKD-like family lipoprotein [Sphingobacterium faecale]MBL1411216.1 hypothetical protein [Sphingobacterium faecale]